MRHSDLVGFESERGEKRRKHRSVGEAFQRSSGSKDAEQDGAINFVRVLNLKFLTTFPVAMENEQTPQEKTKSLKTWLDETQRESWQLELLISGFSIFLLIGAGQWLEELEYDLLMLQQASDKFFLLDILYFSLSTALACLLGCLLLHVVLRGLWVAAVGLRSVSGDIEYESFKFRPRFINRLRKGIGSFDDYILRLERYCSIIFSYAFLLIFCFLGLSLFVFIGAVLGNTLDWLIHRGSYSSNFGILGFFMLIYLIIGVMYMIDFISLGYLKKVRWLEKPYYYFYIFMGWLTFARFYRPLYYNLIDTPFGRKLARLLSLIILVVLVFTSIRYSRYAYIPGTTGDGATIIENNSYDDTYDDAIAHSWRTSLKSRYVQDNYVELFRPYIPINDDEVLLFIDSTLEVGRNVGFYLDGAIQIGTRNNPLVDREALLVAFNKKYRLYINDSLSNVMPRFFNHKDREQFGLLYTIPVHDLPPGEHSLRLDPRQYRTDTVAYSTGRIIYFYK